MLFIGLRRIDTAVDLVSFCGLRFSGPSVLHKGKEELLSDLLESIIHIFSSFRRSLELQIDILGLHQFLHQLNVHLSFLRFVQVGAHECEDDTRRSVLPCLGNPEVRQRLETGWASYVIDRYLVMSYTRKTAEAFR